MSFPAQYTIGSSGRLYKWGQEEIDAWDGDPRGVLWMWQEPKLGAEYYIGIDPSVGRTGWNRYNRINDDKKTDNGCVEVLRRGRDGQCDEQVAEYVAPIDAVEIGQVANVLGRMYAGVEQDQCQIILEVFPGPGALTMQALLERGYENLWRWQFYANSVATPTKSIGWNASPKSNRDLWVKASRHLNLKRAVIRSPWLAEEYADCRMDPVKQWGENPGGHDDRVRAFNLAIWAANRFEIDVERTQEVVTNTPRLDPQASDMTMDEINAHWANTLDELLG